ncbi:MAG: hypothetical protein ABI832_14520 [bacterium]
MKLALHIGTAMTGTSSLQGWFAANRVGLAVQGLCYPLSPGASSHRKLMAYARDTGKADPVFATFGIGNAQSHESFRERLRTDMARELEVRRAKGQQICVMSCELLHSKINTAGMIARLKGLLEPLFDEITVYLHLRPQVDMLVSFASQRCRMGRPVNRAELTQAAFGPQNNLYNHNKIVGLWETGFGAGSLRLIPYKTTPDMIGVISALFGLDRSQLGAVEPEHRELDWRAILLANAVSAGLSALQLDLFIGGLLDGMPGDEGLQLGRRLAQDLQERFAITNLQLADRRSDITLEDLTPDWPTYAEASNLHLIEAPSLFPEQLAHLVRRLAQDRAVAEWRRHMAEGRLAALTGDKAGLERAKRFIQQAAKALDALGYVGAEDAEAPSVDVAAFET